MIVHMRFSSADRRAGRSQPNAGSPTSALLILTVLVTMLTGCSGSDMSRSGDVLFVVRSGESASSVATRLKEEGLIPSSRLFLVRARLGRLHTTLKAGTYRIQRGSTASGILAMMARGDMASLRVTIPEGGTVSSVGAILERSGIVSSEEFIRTVKDPSLARRLGIPAETLEGYLFPDTYFLPPGMPAESIVRLMVSTFRDRVAKTGGAAKLSPEALHEKVILASIVEREYRKSDEAPVIASVFANRLKLGMGLQSCATVVYVMTERQGKAHPEQLYHSDLQTDDPYNTYRWAGLPPGPISNPGLISLKAALDPVRTNFLYFRLVDQVSGTHRFSETLDGHIDAGVFAVKRRGS